MRVPFLISYHGKIKPGGIGNQFAYATDFLPTVLDIAGIAVPGNEANAQQLYRPSGASLLPYLEGRSPYVHAATEAIGFESTGSEAIFKGDYKLLRNLGPFGDTTPKLIHLSEDPTESHDLSASQPEVFNDMRREMEKYVAQNGVIRPPANYDGIRQLLINNWPILLRQMAGVLIAASGVLLIVLAAALYGVRAGWRRWRARVG